MISKFLLPKSLFGRALLILLLPTVLIQLLMAYVFFSRHWDNVTRYMSGSLAGEVAFIVKQINRDEEHLNSILSDFENHTGIKVYIVPADAADKSVPIDDFPEFAAMLDNQIKEHFSVSRFGHDTLRVRIYQPERIIQLETSVKRLESRTTDIFIWWMIGASSVLMLVAVIFLRNQIRPIRKLADAADNFGRGIDMPGFKPSGATEVRTAARAFITMRERIKRQLRTRTDMLAGISHDLRTPLTRMKLQFALIGDSDVVRDLQGDVQQMEHMIQEYLDFARGDQQEEAEKTSLKTLLADIVDDYQRQNAQVTLQLQQDAELSVRISAFRRMLHNIIDNALRYGKSCKVSANILGSACEIIIDDEGSGIPTEKREEVFRPFVRLEGSRNTKTGGVGLGLSISRDIAQAHGGSIMLETSPSGGLRVIIRLPL